MSSEYNEESLPDLLPLYYKRLFPHFHFYRWLSYGKKTLFSKREICFTLLGDIYIRYLSFDANEDFTNELQKKNPVKIDIGAVYSTKPKDKRPGASLVAVERELVFDIDMTDYDDVRRCCSGADICQKCWKFMVIACKILDAALREDFGYNCILWVFSGRRGIHCWVCDESARKLNEAVRAVIAEYLLVVRGGANQKRKVQLPGEKITHSIRRALKFIDEYFMKDIVIEQDILGNEDQLNTFLSVMDEDMIPHFKTPMKKGKSSEARWNIFEETFVSLLQKNQIPRNYKHFCEEIKLQYAYPRLDINVTKGLNHLLKAPFCVHPKTGKICIPFNPKLVDKFDLDQVPSLSLLLNEINAYDEKTEALEKSLDASVTPTQRNKIRDYKKTSLLKGVSIFEVFLRNLELERKKHVEKDVPMDF